MNEPEHIDYDFQKDKALKFIKQTNMKRIYHYTILLPLWAIYTTIWILDDNKDLYLSFIIILVSILAGYAQYLFIQILKYEYMVKKKYLKKKNGKINR